MGLLEEIKEKGVLGSFIVVNNSPAIGRRLEGGLEKRVVVIFFFVISFFFLTFDMCHSMSGVCGTLPEIKWCNPVRGVRAT